MMYATGNRFNKRHAFRKNSYSKSKDFHYQVACIGVVCVAIILLTVELLSSGSSVPESAQKPEATQIPQEEGMLKGVKDAVKAIKIANSDDVLHAMSKLGNQNPTSIEAFKLGLMASGVSAEAAELETKQLLEMPAEARAQVFHIMKQLTSKFNADDTYAKLKEHIKESARDDFERQRVGRYFSEKIFETSNIDQNIMEEVLDSLIEAFDQENE